MQAPLPHRASRPVALLLLVAWAGAAPADEALTVRGEYLFHAAGCESCHTDRKRKGERLAGGRRIVTPHGTFVAPNITPDLETGIGRWREEDFQRALREGVNPNGEHYYPSFPYPAYTRLTDDDVRALYRYLRTVPAVRRRNEPHQLPWYAQMRSFVGVWKALYFRPGRFVPDKGRAASWNRGAYLSLAVAHCGECHTPRDRFGGLRMDASLSGTQEGPEGSIVPNITPHRETGIGRWRASDITQYLETGMDLNGDFAGDMMAEFIDVSMKYLTAADRAAIAEYILSVPAIENSVRKPKKKAQPEY